MSNPIQHVVLIIKENHCFDNYFGTFPGRERSHPSAFAQPAAA